MGYLQLSDIRGQEDRQDSSNGMREKCSGYEKSDV